MYRCIHCLMSNALTVLGFLPFVCVFSCSCGRVNLLLVISFDRSRHLLKYRFKEWSLYKWKYYKIIGLILHEYGKKSWKWFVNDQSLENTYSLQIIHYTREITDASMGHKRQWSSHSSLVRKVKPNSLFLYLCPGFLPLFHCFKLPQSCSLKRRNFIFL